ncbi:MAG TPA: MAE_28990/MAE_18760 family HEPN-like nuclease [Candidatus Acidoferrales bacterium]|nr:MAE_28990/MAE_18760 family HEPN-like nuclease [Candidatus Acidoferrales bacterium]
MSKKNRTLNELNDNLQEEYAWRIKELHDFKSVVDASRNDNTRNALIRSGVALLYAHWEGFVKNAAQNYYTFVSFKRLKHNELKENFIAVCLRKSIHELLETNKVVMQTKSVKFILNELGNQAHFPSRIPIESFNLTYEVLCEYCTLLGLETENYELKKYFIDKKLVENRHKIAHGKYFNVDYSTFNDIYETTIELLDAVKIDIVNAAALEKYRKV